jgi:hypothetical protein
MCPDRFSLLFKRPKQGAKRFQPSGISIVERGYDGTPECCKIISSAFEKRPLHILLLFIRFCLDPKTQKACEPDECKDNGISCLPVTGGQI